MKTFFISIIAAFLSGYSAYGQIQTNATCLAAFDWQENSLNQSPCLVAAYLQGACSSGVWTTPALPHTSTGGKQAYLPPDVLTRNPCTCSWAVYNLISACGACQDGNWLLWPAWSVNCASGSLLSNQAFPQQFPVPPATAIPEYAAKDPSTWTGGGFNLTEANAIGSHNIQITSAPDSSATSSTPAASTSSSPISDGGSSGGPAVGPMVGGVVGGILGVLLIAVIATYLLCPARFRRKQKANEIYPSMAQETKLVNMHPQPQPGSGVVVYTTPPPPSSSHQELLTAGTRPPMAPRFTSSTYSISTADHSINSTLVPQQPVPQQGLTAGPQAPWHQPAQEMMFNSTPSPPNGSVASTTPEIPSTTTGSNATSVRSFFTRAMPRNGHAHTPSDTSVTSASSLLPRMQQGLWRQQHGNQNNVLVPYVMASSSTDTAPTSAASPHFQYPVDRKARPAGLQYTPPPDAPTFSSHGEPSGSDGSEYALVPPAPLTAGPTTAHEVYGRFASSIIGGADLEADRQTNMSPANASSILEAAPPYMSAEAHDFGARGNNPLRRTPRLPDVDEYPEKARFTGDGFA